MLFAYSHSITPRCRLPSPRPRTDMWANFDDVSYILRFIEDEKVEVDPRGLTNEQFSAYSIGTEFRNFGTAVVGHFGKVCVTRLSFLPRSLFFSLRRANVLYFRSLGFNSCLEVLMRFWGWFLGVFFLGCCVVDAAIFNFNSG